MIAKKDYKNLYRFMREETYIEYLLFDIERGWVYVPPYVEQILKIRLRDVRNLKEAWTDVYMSENLASAVQSLFEAKAPVQWYEKHCQGNPDLLQKARRQFCSFDDIPF